MAEPQILRRTRVDALMHPGVRSAMWISGTAVLALLLLYFVGLDQGAGSVFGSDTHIHEFMHDARHLLGFPCH